MLIQHSTCLIYLRNIPYYGITSNQTTFIIIYVVSTNQTWKYTSILSFEPNFYIIYFTSLFPSFKRFSHIFDTLISSVIKERLSNNVVFCMPKILDVSLVTFDYDSVSVDSPLHYRRTFVKILVFCKFVTRITR